MRSPSCACAREFRVQQLRSDEYRRAKLILDHGKHPVFIGRGMFSTAARNGGAMVFCVDSTDLALAIVNPRLNVLLVLNVEPSHRGHELGSAILRYLQCNFARVIESAVPFFERNGYKRVGEMKQGNRYKTQVMVKSSLLPLAGRVARIYGATLTV